MKSTSSYRYSRTLLQMSTDLGDLNVITQKVGLQNIIEGHFENKRERYLNKKRKAGIYISLAILVLRGT